LASAAAGGGESAAGDGGVAATTSGGGANGVASFAASSVGRATAVVVGFGVGSVLGAAATGVAAAGTAGGVGDVLAGCNATLAGAAAAGAAMAAAGAAAAGAAMAAGAAGPVGVMTVGCGVARIGAIGRAAASVAGVCFSNAPNVLTPITAATATESATRAKPRPEAINPLPAPLLLVRFVSRSAFAEPHHAGAASMRPAQGPAGANHEQGRTTPLSIAPPGAAWKANRATGLPARLVPAFEVRDTSQHVPIRTFESKGALASL